MVGLAVVAAIFIGFALTSSFLVPRRWPEFPGRNGLSVFVIVSLLLFGAMLTAVEVFGVEKESEAHAAAAGGKTIQVTESEFHIALPALKTLTPGDYTFEVKNAGNIQHDLVIGSRRTALIAPGGTAKLRVTLEAGTYVLFCAVDAHRKLGMAAKISVG